MKKALYFLKKNKIKIVLYITISLTLLIASISFIIINNKYYNSNNKEISSVSLLKNEKENIESNSIQNTIRVDIKGQIKSPGVYELPYGSRVIDAIELSGGIIENAYTECINLSEILEDEELITIPNQKEVYKNTHTTCTISNTEKSTNQNNNLNTLVNINNASKEVLMTLNGIGESKAQKIIEYRETNGNFKTIDELKKVTGIGESIYAKIKDSITV